MKKVIAAIALTIAVAAHAATPTFAQINSAIEARQLPEARVMMDEVLRKRPESVKAHAINAQLLAAEEKPLEEIQKELALVNSLKGNAPAPVTVVENNHSVLKYFMLALCGVAAIIASFLGWQLVSIKKRKSTNPEKGNFKGETHEQIQETDRSLYSQPLSNHSIR